MVLMVLGCKWRAQFNKALHFISIVFGCSAPLRVGFKEGYDREIF